jgi:hypothetical protein
VTGDEVDLGGLRVDHPGWEIWRRDDGVLCAWLVGARPPIVLYGGTPAELAEAIDRETTGDEPA